MSLLTWTDRLTVGVKGLDDDHRKLLGMMNEFDDGIAAGQDKEALGKILDRLVDYTQIHFHREEQMFALTGYEAALSHRQEHDDLTRQMVEVQRKYNASGGDILPGEVMSFLKKWLVHHILGSDRKYGPHLNSNGVL